MSSPDLIRQHGWKQGSVFRTTDHAALNELGAEPIPEGARCLVVSQTCDVVHPSYENEPIVELLIALPVMGDTEPMRQGGRNPRYLQLPITSGESNRHYELHPARRLGLDRSALEGLTPDPDATLPPEHIDEFARWLCKRYTRAALPDAFNDRLKPSAKAVLRALKSAGSYISGLYLSLDPWEEVAAGTPYRVNLYAAMSPEDYDAIARREIVTQALDRIAAAYGSCDDIEVEIHQVRSEEDVTLYEFRFLTPLDYDYLSFREEPAGEMPPDSA